MPLTDNAYESGGRLDPFLIAGPTTDAPGVVAGLDDFLAVPPIPTDPAAPEADAEGRTTSASHQLTATADLASIATRFGFDEALKAAVPPMLADFEAPRAEPSAVARGLGDVGPSLIAPPDVVFPTGADQGAAIASNVAAGVEEGGGGDVLSTLAANPLDDALLADPSSLLSAVPFAGPAVADRQGADRSDPWSSDSSLPSRADGASLFGSVGLDGSPSSTASSDSWGRGDDRSSTGSEPLDRVEGRLSQAVARLEEAVATLSAPGPAPLGSRPRGFRGRIDA